MTIVESGDDPFRYVVLDDVVRPELLRAANADWPDRRWFGWHVYGDANAQKFASKDPIRIPTSAQCVLHRLADLPVCELMRTPNLFPDLSLHGAGLHELHPGGFLKAHLDSEVHPTMGWGREVSGVLFVNEDWQSDWGGELQFLNSETKDVMKCLPVKFNRLVLFQCRGQAWHQVTPVVPEAGISRRTLALFWWSLPLQEKTGAVSAKFLA